MLSLVASLTPFSDYNQSPRNMHVHHASRHIYIQMDVCVGMHDWFLLYVVVVDAWTTTTKH
jgi:hypothetical protein